MLQVLHSIPIPVVAHPGHDGSVREDDSVAQAPIPPSGSPQSIGGAPTPEPGEVSQQCSNPVCNEGEIGPNSAAIDAVVSEVPKTHARVLRRLMILLGLALIALATGIWALVIFPARPTITNPTPLTLYIKSFPASSDIYLNFFPSETRSAKVIINAFPSLSVQDKNEKPTGGLGTVIFGDFHVSCEANAICVSTPGATYISSSFGIQRRKMIPDEDIVTVEDPRINAASNGESAVVEMPAVVELGSRESEVRLTVSYYVPNADMYDWSIPPSIDSKNTATWSEEVYTTPSGQASEITGINHQAESHDNYATFISGVLLGVTGAAAIGVVQEGLHMVFDDDPEKRRSKLSRLSARS
jgi:hypothetical protein